MSITERAQPPHSELPARAERRALVAASPSLTGLDYVSVTREATRWKVTLHFIPPAPSVAEKAAVPSGFGPRSLQLRPRGGGRTGLVVEELTPRARDGRVELRVAPAQRDAAALVERETYVVSLEGVPGVDPWFASAEFRLDERALTPAAPEAELLPPWSPAGHYLAKDYDSFRTLLLDQLAATLPSWAERNPCDIGVMLVEVLAYLGDALSYRQDAVATEAYLATARLRPSLRRHARLLDYVLHEGCNARTWIHLVLAEGASGPVKVPVGTELVAGSRAAASRAFQQDGAGSGPPVFATLEDVVLQPDQRLMQLYTWGEQVFSLPAGATRAALRGRPSGLRAGAVVYLHCSDASAAGRGQLVRLVADAEPDVDPLLEQPITWIRWSSEDALGAALPVSQRVDGRVVSDLTVVRGNNVLVDAGRRRRAVATLGDTTGELTLPISGLAWAQPWRAAQPGESPAGSLVQDPRRALPQIWLTEVPPEPAPHRGDLRPLPARWVPRLDLLESDREARHFVAEREGTAQVRLRFGDGVFGRRPAPGTRFEVTYRTVSGETERVGAGLALSLLDPVAAGLEVGAVALAMTLVPSSAAAAPEDEEEGRRYPPAMTRVQRRCVTAADWAAAAEEVDGVLQARAELRWTGAWSTAFVTVLRQGGAELDEPLRRRLAATLAPRALMGVAFTLRDAEVVPVEIELEVDVRAEDWTRVQVALHAAFSSGALPTGLPAFFAPDAFGFGRPLYLSQVIARAMEVPGVADARAITFAPIGESSAPYLQAGKIPAGPLQVIRVLGTPGAPEDGFITFRRSSA